MMAILSIGPAATGRATDGAQAPSAEPRTSQNCASARPKRDAKLKRLYDIENGVANLAVPMLKDDIAELKATPSGPCRRWLPGRTANGCGPIGMVEIHVENLRKVSSWLKRREREDHLLKRSLEMWVTRQAEEVCILR